MLFRGGNVRNKCSVRALARVNATVDDPQEAAANIKPDNQLIDNCLEIVSEYGKAINPILAIRLPASKKGILLPILVQILSLIAPTIG